MLTTEKPVRFVGEVKLDLQYIDSVIYALMIAKDDINNGKVLKLEAFELLCRLYILAAK